VEKSFICTIELHSQCTKFSINSELNLISLFTGNKRKLEDNNSKKNKSIKLDESNQSNEESDDETMDFEDDSDDDDEGLKCKLFTI